MARAGYVRMRHIGDDERRARLATRHAIAPARRVADPVAATRAMTVLHSTEPATVYLSLWARVDGLTVADVDRALYDDRTLVKQLAMRRTLFVFPRDLLPAAWGSASRPGRRPAGSPAGQGRRARRARRRRRGLARRRPRGGARRAGRRRRGLTAQRAARGGARAARGPSRARPGHQVGRRRPDRAAGADPARRRRRRSSAGATPATGGCRGRAGRSCPTWLGDVRAAAWPPRRGTPSWCAAGWRRSGPAPRPTSKWWLGSTKSPRCSGRSPTSRRSRCPSTAAAPAGCCPTTSSRRRTGRALGGAAAGARPDDDGLEGARLLPRPEHTPYLFDSNGNAGTTAWWDGRIVGCWVQDDDGVVQVRAPRGRRRRRPPPSTPRPSGSPPGWTGSGSAASTRRSQMKSGPAAP